MVELCRAQNQLVYIGRLRVTYSLRRTIVAEKIAPQVWEVGMEEATLNFTVPIDNDRLENREYGRRDPSRWPRGTLYPQKLASLHRQAAVARSV
jgi:hypothetical protein